MTAPGNEVLITFHPDQKRPVLADRYQQYAHLFAEANGKVCWQVRGQLCQFDSYVSQ